MLINEKNAKGTGFRDMKKLTLIILAAALLLTAGCGKKGSGESGPTPTPGDAARPTQYVVQTADWDNYDNSVKFVDGKLAGSSFNWDYFYGKAKAGYAADLMISVSENGAERTLELSYANGTYSLSEEGSVGIFGRLAEFEAELSSGAEARFFVLTDAAELTASDYFGGAMPENAAPGFENAKGIVVFVKNK